MTFAKGLSSIIPIVL